MSTANDHPEDQQTSGHDPAPITEPAARREQTVADSPAGEPGTATPTDGNPAHAAGAAQDAEPTAARPTEGETAADGSGPTGGAAANPASEAPDDVTDDIWAAALAEQAAGAANRSAHSAETPTEQTASTTQAEPASTRPGPAAPAAQSRDDAAAAASADSAASGSTTDAGGPPDDSAAAASSAAQHLFQPLKDGGRIGDQDIHMIMDIPVQLSVELGRTRLTLKNILELGQGSVVELDGLAGEPLDIYVNGYLIAQGEVVVVDDQYGIRVTDIITPSDRIARLNNRR